MNQIENIVNKLIEAKDAYYNDNPIMTDDEFDALEDELRVLDPNNKYFTIVGAPVISGKKIKHITPMRSCQKAQTIDEVQTWLKKVLTKRVALIIEPKIDGFSATIKYMNGKLQYIATRGDGEVGEDITYITQYMKIPKTIDSKDEIEIRGELYLPKNTKYQPSDGKTLDNLRNIAVGIVKRKDNREDIKYIQFVAYQIISERYPTETSKINQLLKWGFQVVSVKNAMSVREINEYYELYKSTLRERWPYATDGLVIVVDECDLHDEINDKYTVSHHNHYNIAFKPPAESKETEVVYIEWNVSRLGNIIPVAVLKPINIGGANISRVTLNNYQNVEDINLNIGDVVEVSRSNDVIPYLKAIIKHANPNASSIAPVVCPSCGSKLVRNGVHLQCTNNDCEEMNIQRTTYWVVECEMDQVSESTVRQLFQYGIIEGVKDLYAMDYTKLQNLQGFGDKKIENLKKQIEKSKKMTSKQFINKLGIPLVGEKALKKIGIESMNDFWSFNDTTYAVGRNLIAFRNDNEKYIKDLLQVITIADKVKTATKGTVCMTGAGHKGRKELMKEIEDMGYEFVDSVNKDTNILICEDPNGNSSKLEKARKLGVKLVSYQQFFKVN